MPITRLGVDRPAANTTAVLRTFTAPHLISVIATNLSLQTAVECRVDIWVQPTGAVGETQYSYIAKNLLIGVGQSFETFRFAINAQDSIYVKSTNGEVSFTLVGIEQEDSPGAETSAQEFQNKVIRGQLNTLYLDKGLTAERRVDAEEGYVRYNTELQLLEVKTLGGWTVAGAGQNGDIGPTGPTGAVGPAGPEGEQGQQAVAANYLGTLALIADLPTSPTPTTNDAYFVTESGTVYIYNGTAWVDAGPIQGPTGPAGPQGQKGDTGADSIIPGPTGPTGPTGAQGLVGPTGPAVTSISADAIVSPTTDINSNFTLRPQDANGVIRSIGSAITITIPDVLSDGERVEFIQAGTGQVTFEGQNISLESRDSANRTDAQYARVILLNVNSSYYLFGDLV